MDLPPGGVGGGVPQQHLQHPQPLLREPRRGPVAALPGRALPALPGVEAVAEGGVEAVHEGGQGVALDLGRGEQDQVDVVVLEAVVEDLVAQRGGDFSRGRPGRGP